MKPTNQTIQLADYTPHPRNYNRHDTRQIQRIAKSLEMFGQVRSIVVWAGYILAGHGVVEAALSLGWAELRADVLPDGYPEELALAYIAADNELGRLSDPDQAQLAQILEESRQYDERLIEAIGFDRSEFDALLAEVGSGGGGEAGDAEPQIDRAAELLEKWQVQPGDLWRIGEHRLICGDCTDAATVARVMGGERAALLVTSPPYGVGKDYEIGGVDEWLKTVRGCFSAAINASDLWFVNLGNKRTGGDFETSNFAMMENEIRKLGYGMISSRIWVKDPAWAGQNPYWLQTYKPVDDFEFLGTFARRKPKYKKRLTDEDYKQWGWRGVWEFPSVKSNSIHSAMFPLELPSRAVKLFTDDGDLIYEPFAGSGTTLVACQNLSRRCRAVEISPAYCAVILERMAEAFPDLEIERVNG